MADEKDEIARAQAAKQGCPFLNTEQAAAYLGLSPRKLRYMRSRCTGPRYRLHSRFVRYHIDDLIFWSRSTSPVAGGQGSTPRSGAEEGAWNAPEKPQKQPQRQRRRGDA